MIQKKRIILIVGIMAIGIIIYRFYGDKKEMVIHEELLNLSEIQYLEVVGMDNTPPIIITDKDDIQRIHYLLQKLNGPKEVTHNPSNEAILGISITLKEHYPSSAILIYPNQIFQGQGRYVSEELVNELLQIIGLSI